MTTREIIDEMVKIDPSRTYSATKNAWCYSHIEGEGKHKVEYVVSIQPAMSGYGDTCTLIMGKTFDHCLAQYQAMHPTQPTEENNE